MNSKMVGNGANIVWYTLHMYDSGLETNTKNPTLTQLSVNNESIDTILLTLIIEHCLCIKQRVLQDKISHLNIHVNSSILLSWLELTTVREDMSHHTYYSERFS